MNCAQAIKHLKSVGDDQTRKTYMRHGAPEPVLGVKYAELYKLVKTIKVDHGLALELWDSGIYDARILATMIADPDAVTTKLLTAWIKEVVEYGLSFAMSVLAHQSDAGMKLMPKWMEAKSEWVCATGWSMIGGITRDRPESLSKKECLAYLKTIEKRIHGSKNRVKYSMNGAMIGMGGAVDGLAEEAIAFADRIGKVDVDHGDSSCKTPLATPYIRKAASRRIAKSDRHAAKAAKNKGTQKAATGKKPAAKKKLATKQKPATKKVGAKSRSTGAS